MKIIHVFYHNTISYLSQLVIDLFLLPMKTMDMINNFLEVLSFMLSLLTLSFIDLTYFQKRNLYTSYHRNDDNVLGRLINFINAILEIKKDENVDIYRTRNQMDTI
jgi:hypothetical protein